MRKVLSVVAVLIVLAALLLVVSGRLDRADSDANYTISTDGDALRTQSGTARMVWCAGLEVGGMLV